MNLPPVDQTLQFIAWFLALTEFILAFYVLLLNVWHTANRHVSALFLAFAINNFALGLMVGATNATQAALPTYLLAATSPAMQPGLFLVAVILLKPRWLRGRWRRGWWLVYGLVFLPSLLTLVDVGLGTQLWYTGLNAETYVGGYISVFECTAGSLSRLIQVLNFYVMSIVTIFPLLYIALRDKEATSLTRWLAWLLLGVQIISVILQMGLRGLLGPPVRVLILGIIYVFAYAYAGFQQMISERRLQRGRLQTRLTALILIVTVPILVAVVAFVSARAGALVEQVAAQQPAAELLSALRQFQQVSWTVLAAGVAMLLVLAWLTIRQALRPIGTLTETVAAIAAGDLTRTAPVESEDEIGVLAHAFNSMTEQLRGLISGLEQRVADRTRDLEQRSGQLEAAAHVAREAVAIHDTGQLLEETTRLISDRFHFYHAGIFLLDEAREYAVLQTASSEGGQRMLARGYKSKIDEGSIVGYVASLGKPRITLDVGENAVRFDNPDLPLTRSEMALPLKVREQVIGVLDVQSTEEDAFSNEDLAILQTMADQVSLAIENARLLEESQRALRELEALYGRRVREAWQERATSQPAAYRYTSVGVEPAPPSLALEMEATPLQHQPVVVQEQGKEGRRLTAAIRLRGQTLGSIVLRQGSEGRPWSNEEIALVEELSTQIGLALENARLLEETRRRAEREQLIGKITTRVRETLDVDTVLQTAIREIGEALDMPEIEVRMGKWSIE